MARQQRIHIEGGLYYTVSKVEPGLSLFKDEIDYNAYRQLVEKYKTQHSFTLHAQALFPTEVYMLIELGGSRPDPALTRGAVEHPTISDIMHDINSNYTKYYNSKYHRKGHLFQERYHCVLVEKAQYLKEVAGYINGLPNQNLQINQRLEKAQIFGSEEFVKAIKGQLQKPQADEITRGAEGTAGDKQRIKKAALVYAAVAMLAVGVLGFLLADYIAMKKSVKMLTQEEERLFTSLKKSEIKRMVAEYRKDELESKYQAAAAEWMVRYGKELITDKDQTRENKEL